MNRLGIIVPCYNEEEVFDDTNLKLTKLIKFLIKKKKIASNSFILYVNDGSKDSTWDKISNEVDKNKYVQGLCLAKNVGHQNALLSGLNTLKDIVDISISIDADLQDDIFVMEEMIDKYNNGIDIVYGVRNGRTSDSFFKRFTAQTFYKFMNHMGVKTIYNHADYRLLSKRAMEELSKYKEKNLFLRGIIPLIGYSTDTVYYARNKRLMGVSKYPLKKMLNLAIDGITSFSIKPMMIIFNTGIIIMLLSIITILCSLIFNFISNLIIILCVIGLFSGLQVLFIGIIGIYIGKTYIEVKNRPRYNIKEYRK